MQRRSEGPKARILFLGIVLALAGMTVWATPTAAQLPDDCDAAEPACGPVRECIERQVPFPPCEGLAYCLQGDGICGGLGGEPTKVLDECLEGAEASPCGEVPLQDVQDCLDGAPASPCEAASQVVNDCLAGANGSPCPGDPTSAGDDCLAQDPTSPCSDVWACLENPPYGCGGLRYCLEGHGVCGFLKRNLPFWP